MYISYLKCSTANRRREELEPMAALRETIKVVVFTRKHPLEQSTDRLFNKDFHNFLGERGLEL